MRATSVCKILVKLEKFQEQHLTLKTETVSSKAAKLLNFILIELSTSLYATKKGIFKGNGIGASQNENLRKAVAFSVPNLAEARDRVSIFFSGSECECISNSAVFGPTALVLFKSA